MENSTKLIEVGFSEEFANELEKQNEGLRTGGYYSNSSSNASLNYGDEFTLSEDIEKLKNCQQKRTLNGREAKWANVPTTIGDVSFRHFRDSFQVNDIVELYGKVGKETIVCVGQKTRNGVATGEDKDGHTTYRPFSVTTNILKIKSQLSNSKTEEEE